MKFNEIFSGADDVKQLLNTIQKEAKADKNYNIMEVCGTHTMSIAKYGIVSLLPNNVRLTSGPGCPVCVTSQADIDNCVDLSKDSSLIITTFGDMLKVVGSDGNSLYSAKAGGADVRTIYSPLDSIKIAEENSEKAVVFIAVGFETTTPMAAALVKVAHSKKLKNISVISLCKTMPAAFDLLLKDASSHIDGFLCPGNVSIITGVSIYEPMVAAGKSAVISGFEPIDILSSVLESIKQINSGKFSVVNNYLRACSTDGNKKALELTYSIFQPFDARWRGLGVLPNSGMKLKDEYAVYDAEKVHSLDPNRPEPATACKCGDILKGVMTPRGCPLFGKACTPSTAVGPCMVSSEGACAAIYKYGLMRGV